MSARSRSGHERGFVAIEWVAAVALLLLPVVVLVATLPEWAERRHAATVAAREAARELVREWPNADPEQAAVVARDVAVDHGVGAGDVVVEVLSTGVARGDEARVAVRVMMPAISVAGMSAGAWQYTAVEVRRIDDYRSR
jgi:hypothetical protein